MSEALRTRSMRASDVERVAEIHVAAWRVAYEGIVRRERMNSLSVAATAGAMRRRFTASRANHIVCEWRGELFGFASFGPARAEQADPGVAEVYALYVHPDRWGAGCGRALVEDVRERLCDDWEELVLWTLEENAAARSFYLRVGFQEVPDSARLRPDLGAHVLLFRLPLVSRARGA